MKQQSMRAYYQQMNDAFGNHKSRLYQKHQAVDNMLPNFPRHMYNQEEDKKLKSQSKIGM